jgi:hypothetical protein
MQGRIFSPLNNSAYHDPRQMGELKPLKGNVNADKLFKLLETNVRENGENSEKRKTFVTLMELSQFKKL